MPTPDEKLDKAFNSLQAAYPVLTAGKEAMGSGHYGIVIGDRDDYGINPPTVTKVLYRMDDPDSQREAQAAFDNEVNVLRLLKGTPLGNAQIPALVKEPEAIDDKQFFAAYTMTKVPGLAAGAGFERLYRKDAPAETQENFREAGRLLAHFHRAAAVLGDTVPAVEPNYGERVMQVRGVDGETNRALAAADSYLQAHKKAAVVHRDFHGGNVTVDEHGKPIGLLDFAMTARSGNRDVDFANIPADAFAYFKEGYEQESGETINPMMVTMTNIGGCATVLDHFHDNPEKRQKWLEELNKNLNDARSVTGFTPPAMS